MVWKCLRSLWIMIAVTLSGLEVCICSTVSVPPEPVTTTEGAEFIIKCGVAATSDIEGVRVKRIVKEDGITEETVYQSLPPEWVDTDFDKTKYSLTNEGSFNVKITVKNVNFQDAGTYICEPIVLAENRATAAVLVLEKPLVTVPKITAGELFQATCEVQFMAPPDIIEGDSHFPELVGKVDNIEYEGLTKFTNGKLGTDINAKLEKIMNITLTESSDGQSFWCIARTPTPSHEETSSKILDIKFEVTQPQLPKNDLFSVGEVICCQAKGKPKPTITWKPIKSKAKGTRNENLTIVEEMVGEPIEEWECEARNDIYGLTVVKKAKINFRVEPSDETPTVGTPVWMIVIGVIISSVILCTLVGLFLFRKLRGQKTNHTGNTRGSGISQNIVNAKEDDTGMDNLYCGMEENKSIPVQHLHDGYLTPTTDVSKEDEPKNEDAGYLSPLPSEPEPRQRPGPVVKMETKSDVLNHLPANVKKEAMKFVLEVEGLHYVKDIGKGHFGKVYLCKLIQGTHSCLVAVKSMNGGHFRKPAEVQAFIQEALKIKDFRNDCILSPLGIVFHQGSPKIILPYMENGDLRGFLAKKMSSSGAFKLVKLLRFCLDVAKGMSYLSRQRFAHMDLAARNCMVDGMLRVKVGDFGMTHDLYEKSYYRMSKSKPLPVRWMAPESITENKFTCKSDVWSYGVVMWEVFTHGDQPYKHLDNRQFLNKFTTGGFVRLEQPDLCPEEIYSMMCECWNPNPEGRPRFSVMKAELERISNAPIMNV